MVKAFMLLGLVFLGFHLGLRLFPTYATGAPPAACDITAKDVAGAIRGSGTSQRTPMSQQMSALGAKFDDDAVARLKDQGTLNSTARMRENLKEAGFPDEFVDTAELAMNHTGEGAIVRMVVVKGGKRQEIAGEFAGADKDYLYFSRPYDTGLETNVAIPRKGLEIKDFRWMNSSSESHKGFGYAPLPPRALPEGATVRLSSTRKFEDEIINSDDIFTVTHRSDDYQPGVVRSEDIEKTIKSADDFTLEVQQKRKTFSSPAYERKPMKEGLVPGARVQVEFDKEVLDRVSRASTESRTDEMIYVGQNDSGVTFLNGNEVVEISFNDLKSVVAEEAWYPAREIRYR